MELAGYINKNDFMINEVKKGIELINELIKNLENDLSYYTAKINNLTSKLDKKKIYLMMKLVNL